MSLTETLLLLDDDDSGEFAITREERIRRDENERWVADLRAFVREAKRGTQ